MAAAKDKSQLLIKSMSTTRPEENEQLQGASAAKSPSDKCKFLVLDLKATCVRQEEGEPFEAEIIEFSSILVAANGDPLATFHTYVKPTANSVLSSFCVELNGIQQEDVDGDDAVELPVALRSHGSWLAQTNGGDEFVVVTWGDWDCRTMLHQECQRKELEMPDYFLRWINLKETFVAWCRNESYRWLPVHDAVAATNELIWEGDQKGGESHVRNKARLLAFLKERATFTVTELLPPVPDAAATTSTTTLS